MKNLIIDYGEGGTKAAYVENGKLVELIVENYSDVSQTNSIFVGRVKNILPSKFVFIDIGNKRNGLLYLNDNKEEQLSTKSIKVGQKILVQVIKNESGKKGAYLTTRLTLKGKFATVFTTSQGQVGISKKITDKAERERLKGIGSSCLEGGFGLILRTMSQGQGEEAISLDIKNLMAKLKALINSGESLNPPALVYSEGSVIKELFTRDLDKIIINSTEMEEEVRALANSIFVGLGNKVELYMGEENIFSYFFLDKEIERALQKRVWLKSGGFLIIEQTEACFVIDVNTGKFTTRKGHGETVLKTNLEACVQIAKEMRLRNLFGMIVIDFIPMKDSDHRRELYKAFSEELKKDRVSAHIVGITQPGLVQVTRRITGRPLRDMLMKDCQYCKGTGKHMLR